MYIQKYYKVIRVIKNGDGGATPLYIENVSDSDGVFKLQKSGSPTYTPNLIYRIGDNGEWFEYDFTTLPSITVPSGSKIYFRGDNPTGFNKEYSDYYKFTFTNNYNIGGYITSLLAIDNFNTITNISEYCFAYLFLYQPQLVNARDLITENITFVKTRGFYKIFSTCSNLLTPPNFNGVEILESEVFSYCFEDCTSLTTAPEFNNIKTLSKQSIFRYCFINCTSLTIAPDFRNITNIPSNIDGFGGIFKNCTSLQVVYAPNITTWNESTFKNWVDGVATTGIVYKPTGLTIPTGTSGVPEGWTTVDY